MGWHTNSKSPGWRLYISYAEETGKSFFRYRDPDTGQVVTSMDAQWNFRLFRIDSTKPFWHAVYSETNRYSFGYRIVRKPSMSFATGIIKKLAGVIEDRVPVRLGVLKEG